MERTYIGIVLTVLAATTLLAYNNCSQVGFADNEKSSSITGLGTPTTPPVTAPNPTPTPTATPTPPPTVQQAIKNCADATAAGTLKTSTQTITFDDSRVETGMQQICQWNTGDNLAMKDGFMTARYEQNRSLTLPAGAVLCDVQMTTAQQKFSYDDILFLNFNGRILGSDNKAAVTSKLTPEMVTLSSGKIAPLYTYDWLSLRGAPFQNVADDYCLGSDQQEGTCMWPVTQQTGNIVFQFNPELLIAIGLKEPSDQQYFSLVITGDNDPSTDCYHQALSFDMQVKYYLP